MVCLSPFLERANVRETKLWLWNHSSLHTALVIITLIILSLFSFFLKIGAVLNCWLICRYHGVLLYLFPFFSLQRIKACSGGICNHSSHLISLRSGERNHAHGLNFLDAPIVYLYGICFFSSWFVRLYWHLPESAEEKPNQYDHIYCTATVS